MSTEPLGDAMRRMGRLTGLQSALSLTDAQLLERFVGRRDEPAFAALMVRHGPMVLCLCRQMLRDAQEAEDAFQASFLVLARNAASIQKRPSLSAWLYGVAYRVAARLRGSAARRRIREAPGVDLSALAGSTEPANLDLQPVLHEEIRRLPIKYRAPVVLCYLESKTNEEAARQLSWPVGTVKARLSRARDMLRMRLERRGMGGADGLLAEASPAARNTASILPIFLLDSTVRAAMRLATGGGGLTTVRAASLAKAVAAAMHLAKLKLTTVAVLAACLLGAGTTSLTILPPTANTADTGAQHSARSELEKSDVANGTDEKTEAAPVKSENRVRDPNTVCKRDAMQRLRELVEQLLQGTVRDQPPVPHAEQGRPAEWQAHPFPQAPVQRKGGMEVDAGDPDCMES
jgi:RNA polymerase sigma factor (sigma-70 family)